MFYQQNNSSTEIDWSDTGSDVIKPLADNSRGDDKWKFLQTAIALLNQAVCVHD